MSARPFRLVQISDLHLPAPGQCYRGVDVWAHLSAVLRQVAAEMTPCDRLLVTGDNVHDGGEPAYRRLCDTLDRTGLRWSWIPGNHDDVALMRRCRAEALNQFELPGWRSLLLDSSAEPDGRGAGTLSADSWQRLSEAASSRVPVLVVVHHNPLPVESRWQDAISLQQAERFWDLMAALPAGSLVLCGHVHQVWEWRVDRQRVLSCPSTAVQFKPRCDQLVLESDGAAALPGYRWLELHPDGRLRSGIERVRLA